MMKRTNSKMTQDSPTDDRNRLALLWRAFEEAEARIKDLERELDHRRPPSDGSTVVIDERAFEREVRARYEKAADELRRDHEILESNHRAERLAHASEADALRRASETNARVAAENERALATARAQLADVREQLAIAERRVLDERRAIAEERKTRELDASFHEAARARMSSELEISRSELAGAMMEVESLLAERASWQRNADDARIEAEDARDQVQAVVAHLQRTERDFAEHIQVSTLREAELLADWLSSPTIETAPAPRAIPRVERLYPFVMRRIREMPSVSAEEVASLRAVGINTTDALLYADLVAVHATTLIPMPRLARLRALAELSSIHGVAHRSAERLFAAGARTIRDVARMTPDELARVVTHESGRALAPEHIESILHNATFEEVLQFNE